MNDRFKFTVGVIAAAAVELLAKGPWAHAVWIPAVLMLITDGEKVLGFKVPPVLSHRVRFFLGVGAAAGVEILAKGAWAHAVWAPAIIMLLTDAENVFGGPGTPAPDAAQPVRAASSANDDTITPVDKPPAK